MEQPSAKLCQICGKPLKPWTQRGKDPRRTHSGPCRTALMKKEGIGWFGINLGKGKLQL